MRRQEFYHQYAAEDFRDRFVVSTIINKSFTNSQGTIEDFNNSTLIRLHVPKFECATRSTARNTFLLNIISIQFDFNKQWVILL